MSNQSAVNFASDKMLIEAATSRRNLGQIDGTVTGFQWKSYCWACCPRGTG